MGAQQSLRLSSVRSIPEVIHKTMPAYSADALRAGLEGRVTLAAQIGTDGKPRDIRVLRGLGAGLDEQALECLRQWTFRPALGPFGNPVRAHATVEIVFSLEDLQITR